MEGLLKEFEAGRDCNIILRALNLIDMFHFRVKDPFSIAFILDSFEDPQMPFFGGVCGLCGLFPNYVFERTLTPSIGNAGFSGRFCALGLKVVFGGSAQGFSF